MLRAGSRTPRARVVPSDERPNARNLPGLLLRSPRLLTLLGCLACCAFFGCSTPRPAAPAQVRQRSAPHVARAPAHPAVGLYAPEEALSDALSGHWEYLGTGPWPGIARSHACVFRNDRVLIVNVYCTISESPAFRVDVFSPERGRVRIYAESNGPVSKYLRRDYFSFTAESEPPPGPELGLSPLALSMSFHELQAYDARRYDAFLPACYGGEHLDRAQGGCLGTLKGHGAAWSARNRAFLEQANADWYRLVKVMRVLAGRYGFEPR